ncbi:MAG TPA: hypothetical protein EYG99_02680 [Candidatus Pacebacteria bacterium]|nr:hypothetical protein [Candidatus Paceibacterota bacterium]
MRKFIKKYYIQLMAIVILFVLVVVMLSQSFSMRSMIKDKSKELRQTQLDYALAHEFLRNRYEFKKNTEYVKSDSEWLSMFLPDDDDEKVQLFSTLEQLARDTGNENITLAVVSSAPKTKQKKATEKTDEVKSDIMTINVALLGSYNDLIYFLEKIENMKYFADVKSLNTSKTDEDARRVNRDGEVEGVSRDDLLRTNMNIIFYLEK